MWFSFRFLKSFSTFIVSCRQSSDRWAPIHWFTNWKSPSKTRRYGVASEFRSISRWVSCTRLFASHSTGNMCLDIDSRVHSVRLETRASWPTCSTKLWAPRSTPPTIQLRHGLTKFALSTVENILPQTSIRRTQYVRADAGPDHPKDVAACGTSTRFEAFSPIRRIYFSIQFRSTSQAWTMPMLNGPKWMTRKSVPWHWMYELNRFWITNKYAQKHENHRFLFARCLRTFCLFSRAHLSMRLRLDRFDQLISSKLNFEKVEFTCPLIRFVSRLKLYHSLSKPTVFGCLRVILDAQQHEAIKQLSFHSNSVYSFLR